MNQDLANRFNHHPPTSTEIIEAHEQLREECHALAIYLDEVIPDGREKSTALTNLEQVMMWGNAGIARNQ